MARLGKMRGSSPTLPPPSEVPVIGSNPGLTLLFLALPLCSRAVGALSWQAGRPGRRDRVDALWRDCYDQIAGWSSLVARWAHNPKVGGSNPPPATNSFKHLHSISYPSSDALPP